MTLRDEREPAIGKLRVKGSVHGRVCKNCTGSANDGFCSTEVGHASKPAYHIGANHNARHAALTKCEMERR